MSSLETDDYNTHIILEYTYQYMSYIATYYISTNMTLTGILYMPNICGIYVRID